MFPLSDLFRFPAFFTGTVDNSISSELGLKLRGEREIEIGIAHLYVGSTWQRKEKAKRDANCTN
jgi:hypothetical protein